MFFLLNYFTLVVLIESAFVWENQALQSTEVNPRRTQTMWELRELLHEHAEILFSHKLYHTLLLNLIESYNSL